MIKRKKHVTIVLCLVVVIFCISCIYAFTRPKKPLLVLKDDMHQQVIEYGEKITLKLEDYLDLSTLLEEEKTDVLKNTVMQANISNEEGKDYPAVGEYPILIDYKEESVESQLIVKDTVAPVFNNMSAFEFVVDEEFDYSQYIKANDLSSVTIDYQTQQVNSHKVGSYTAKVIATDSYSHQTEKEILVKVIAKPTSDQEAKTIVDEEKGTVKVQITNKEKKETEVKKTETPKQEAPKQEVPKTETPATKPEETPKEVIELSVPYINQYAYNAPMGCEGAALLQALQGKGYATGVNLKTFLDQMPYTQDGNPHHGYVSSPYIEDSKADVFQSIFPLALTPYGNQYGTCQNMTGATPSQLVKQLKAGHPSVVYVTYKFKAPKWSTFSFGKCVENMHVMTLIGYDENTGKYKVMDPAGLGSYWVSKNSFEKAYNALRYAITVL